jgi:hypothetical protein
MRKYLIGSGCYMKIDGQVEESGGIKKADEDVTPITHMPDFFKLWIRSLEISTSPELVFIVDAHSPAIPSLEFENRFPILWHRRVDNLGHLPGWKDGVLKGAEFALWKKLDFVYVEQDCLLWGKDIVNYSRERMTTGLMLGSGEDTTMPIEQSFFIVKCEFLPEFISKIQVINGSMPEVEYIEWFHDQYDLFPFRGGRQRPLDFETDFGFVQRLSGPEFQIMIQKIGQEGG